MAVDYGMLSRIPSVGARFAAGQEAGRAAAAQNMLLQQRQLEFQQAQEDRRLAMEERRMQREAAAAQVARRGQLAQVLRQSGMDPSDLKTATQFYADALEANDPTAIAAGKDWVSLAREAAQARAAGAEYQGIMGGGAPAPMATPMVAAPAPMATPMAAPAVAPMAPEAPALDERGVNRAAWMAKAGLEEDIAPPPVNQLAPQAPAAPPVNQLAAAPAPAPAAAPTPAPAKDDAAALRAEAQRLEAAQQRLRQSPFEKNQKRAQELDKPIERLYKRADDIEKSADRTPLIVDGRLVSRTGQIIYEPPPGPIKPSERYVPVGQNVFDRVEGKFIEGPARAAIRAETEARVKPAAGARGPAARREAAAGAPSAAPAEGPGAKPPRPMTEAEIAKRRDLVGKEFRNAATALQNLEDTLDSSYQVRTAPGLSRATGYTGTMLPSFPGGAAAQAETRLDNLRGKITAMGKATAAMTGAIGSIANQEWKILADQIAVIDPKKGVQPLTEQLDALERQAEAAMERIRNGYSRIYGEDFSRFPQLRDLPAPKSVRPRAATSGAAPAGNTVTLPDGRVMNFPDAAAAAAFKKAAGL